MALVADLASDFVDDLGAASVFFAVTDFTVPASAFCFTATMGLFLGAGFATTALRFFAVMGAFATGVGFAFWATFETGLARGLTTGFAAGFTSALGTVFGTGFAGNFTAALRAGATAFFVAFALPRGALAAAFLATGFFGVAIGADTGAATGATTGVETLVVESAVGDGDAVAMGLIIDLN